MTKWTALLGWFFVVSYGDVSVPFFHTKVACETARTETVKQLKTLSSANAQRVSLACTEDVAPPINATVSGALTFDGKILDQK